MAEKDGGPYQSMSAWKIWKKKFAKICGRGKKNPLAKEATFCLQPCASNISKTKINKEGGLSWYQGEKKGIFQAIEVT